MVLTGCDPNCLTFMNSWGQEFADGGFFRVEDENVLNETTFYDVYWEEEDLTRSEKEAYEREGIKRSKELLRKFSSIKDLSHTCPNCLQSSNIGDYYGHILEARCPRCHKKFRPTNKDIMNSLYSKAHNL